MSASESMTLLASVLSEILLLVLEREMVGTSGLSLFGIIWNLLDVSTTLTLVSAASWNMMFFAVNVPPRRPICLLSVMLNELAVFLADKARSLPRKDIDSL